MSTSISISASAAAAQAHTHARVHYGVSPASCVAMVHVRDSHASYVAFASVDAVQLFRIGPAFDHVQSLHPPPSFASFDAAKPSLHVSALAGHASNGNIAVALSDGRLLVYSPEYSLPLGSGAGMGSGAPCVSAWALTYQSTLGRPATSLAWTKETLLVGNTHSISAFSSTTNWSQTWSIKCAPGAPIVVLAPSPDNLCLATTSMDDCLVKVWTSSTGGPITSAPPRSHSFFYLPHPQPVTSVSWRRTKAQRVLLTNCTDGVARVWKWSAKLKLFLLTVAIDPQSVMEDAGLAPSSCFWLGAEAIAPQPQASVYLSNSASERVVRTDPELAELVREYDELVMSGESNGTVLVWGIRNLSRQTGDTSAALIKVVPNCFRPEHFATLACPHTVQFAFNTSLEHLLLLGASAQGTLSCLSVNIGHLVYRPYTKMRLVRQWSGHTLSGLRPTAYGVGKWLVTQVGPEALVWDPANRHSGLRQVNGLRLKSRCMLHDESAQDMHHRLWYLPLDGKSECVVVSRSQVQCGNARFQFEKQHGVPLDAGILPAGSGSESQQQRLSIICSAGLVMLSLPTLDPIHIHAALPSVIDHAALFSVSDRYHAVLLTGASLRLIDSSGSTIFHDSNFSPPANILQLLSANHMLVIRTADAVHVYTIGLVHHAVTLERTLPLRANHAAIFPLPTGGVVLAISRDHHVQVFARRVGLASPSTVLDPTGSAKDEPVTPSQPTGLLPTLPTAAATPAHSAKQEPIPVMDLAALEWYTLTTVSLPGFVDAIAWTSQGDLVAMVAHTLIVLDPIPTLVQEALDAQSPALDSGSVLREWLRWNRPEVVRAILNHVYYSRRAGVDRTPVVPWDVVEEAAGIKGMKGATGEGGGSGDGLSLATKTAGDELDALFAAGAGGEVLDMDLIDTKHFNQEKAKALREILEQSLSCASSATVATLATATTGTDAAASTTASGAATLHPVSAAVIRDMQLLAILDAISEPESASMDENGQRFRWDVLLYMHSTKRNLPTPPLSPESQAFAFFSDDQPALVDYILNACTITWDTATALGAGWWLTHPDALRTMAEAIARNHWRKANNPHDCFLYYLALGKRKLMLTLWKQANGHAEQQVMMQFLAKDVNDAWKKQALKNAFVLLGKQRFELAACFFLLGEAYGDAITVCIRNLKDPQLALFVAKLVGQPGVATVVDQIRASGSGVIESHACFGMMADWMAGSRMVDMAKVASPATYLLVQSMEHKLQVQYLASAGITPQERREAVGRAVAWYHERGAPYFTRLMMATLPVANGCARGDKAVPGEEVQPEVDEFAAMFGGGLSNGPPKVSDAGGADDFEAMFGESISDGPPKRSNGGSDDFDALFGSPDPKPAVDSEGAGSGGDAFDALFGDSSTRKPIDEDSTAPATTSTSAPASGPVELLTSDEKSMIVQADHLSTLWQVAKSIFVVQSTPLAHDLQFDDYAKVIMRQIHSGPDSPAHIDSLLDLLCWLTLSPNSAFYVRKQLNVDLFLSLNLRILVHILGRTGPEDLDENQRSMFLMLLLHCLHTLGDSALLDPTAPASAAPHSAIVTTLFLLVHVLASRGLYRALGAVVKHLPVVIAPMSPGLALSSTTSSPLVSLRAMHSELQPHLADLPSSRHLVLEYLTLRVFQDWMYAVIIEFQQGMSADEVFVVSDVCVPHLTARLRWIHDEVHRSETLVQSPAEDWLPSAHQELFEALKWNTVWLDELRVPRIALKEVPVAGPGAALPAVSTVSAPGAAAAEAAVAAKPTPLEEGFLRLAAFNTAQASESAARASADPTANPTGLRTIVTPMDPPFVPKIDTVFKHDAIINGMSLHPSCANLIVAQAKAVIELSVERAHKTMQRVLSGGSGLQPPSQPLPPSSATSNTPPPPPLAPNLSSTSLSAMGAHTAVVHDPYAGTPPAVLTRTSSMVATDDPTTLISPALSNRSAATTASTISGIGADFIKKARQAVDSTLGTGAAMPASGIANEFGVVDFLPTSHAQVASHSALDYFVLADWIDNNTILSLRQYCGRGDLLRIPYGAAKVNKLEIDSVGGRLAVADTVGDVAIFGLPSMRIFSSFPCHSRFASDVVFHGSSTLLVSAGSSPGHINNVALWDTLLPVHSARVRGYNIHESGATAVAYDGRLVYSGGKKGDMHVLDTRHSRPLLSLQAHGSTIASLAVSPNSSLLYSGSIDGTLKVWDMSTSSPTEIATFKHMHGTRKFLSVSAAATLPVSSVGITKILAGDGFVLTCGADGAVKWLH